MRESKDCVPAFLGNCGAASEPLFHELSESAEQWNRCVGKTDSKREDAMDTIGWISFVASVVLLVSFFLIISMLS